jgi:sugar phosphate isomerase/epimerase
MKTGVQQIMLGSITGKQKEALQTLKEIKAMGYDGIELNGFMIHPTSFFIRTLTKLAGMPTGKGGKHDWHALIKESGLEVISLHTDLGSLKRDLSQVAQEAKSFATKFVVITGMYRFDYTSTEALKSLCADLNACGEALKKEGLTLCYHNHNVEFQRLENGQTAFSYLLQHTNPEFVFFEFDSYWAAEAGVNVYKLLAGLKGRVKLHHINDRGSKAKGPFMTPILESDSMELGTGNMDLEELILLDKEIGVEAIVLETHRNFLDHSPISSIRKSREYLEAHL